MSTCTKDQEKALEIEKIEHVSENLLLSEKVVISADAIQDDSEQDTDIQIVNELSTMEDDPKLPCFTLRVFVTGVVS